MDDKWVNWRKLANKSTRQTLTDLQSFLRAKALMDGVKATQKAIECGFAQVVEGRDRWSVRRYILMAQADKKVRKLRAQGRPINTHLLRRALISGDVTENTTETRDNRGNE